MSDFYEDLKRGKVGEDIFLAIHRNKVLLDMRGDCYYQDNDIDFIVNGHTYEVKTDYRVNRTGQVAVEIKHVYNESNHVYRGWLYTTKAEFISYVDPVDRVTYTIKTSDLKELAERESKTYWHYNDLDDVALKLVYVTAPQFTRDEDSAF